MKNLDLPRTKQKHPSAKVVTRDLKSKILANKIYAYNGVARGLSKIKRVHFVGIGGIGVSAIARMMIGEGKKVSGSDTSLSSITEELQKLGAKIFPNHNADNVANDVDLIVYTPAASEDNPEIKKGKKLGISCLSYPEMLGIVSKDRHTIAVSGSHGKTTTTAMIAKVLIDANLDPMVIVGSLLKDQNSNLVSGKGKYFVVEACEFKKSFLNINPKIIVITNIDNDHLDYYKTFANIKKAFAEFAEKLPKDGYLICDPSDENLKEVIEKTKGKIIDYTKVSNNFNLKIPGEHNIKNAKASMAVSQILGVDEKKTLASLHKFTGTWRRFEYKGNTAKGSIVYDDYGHHPTEIKATLKGAKEFFGKKKIFCVFQPHLYSRTKLLMKDFSKSFGDADEVILADIYGAREEKDPSVNSQKLAEEIRKNNKKVFYFKTFSEIERHIAENSDKNSAIITMGAGDIYRISDGVVSKA